MSLLDRFSSFRELLDLDASKSDRRRFEILEGAIKAYAKLEPNNVKYEQIAEKAKTSRPLVKHYFPERGDLFELMIKYIRLNFQKLAIKAAEAEADGENYENMLSAYISSCFQWIVKHPNHFRVWLYYFYTCSHTLALKKHHTEMTSMGQKRIAGILDLGVENGEFPPGDNLRRAKQIQRLITGALVELFTEKADIKLVEEETLDICLNMISKT